MDRLAVAVVEVAAEGLGGDAGAGGGQVGGLVDAQRGLGHGRAAPVAVPPDCQ